MKSKTIQPIANIAALLIIFMVAISYLFVQHDKIQEPYILLAGACFTVLNLKHSQIQLLQHLTVFYLFMILIETFSSMFFIMPLGTSEISVPLSFVVLLAFAIVYPVSQINCPAKITERPCKNLLLSIAVSIILIMAQMFILFFMLQKFYGYGYEYNFSILGKLIFATLMFLFTYETFEKAKFRQLSAFILAIIFIILVSKGLSLRS